MKNIDERTIEKNLSIVDQVRQASYKQNRLATIEGGILGAVVPLATYTVAHTECADRPVMWLLVVGGLTYSAMTAWLSLVGINAVSAGCQLALDRKDLSKKEIQINGNWSFENEKNNA